MPAPAPVVALHAVVVLIIPGATDYLLTDCFGRRLVLAPASRQYDAGSRLPPDPTSAAGPARGISPTGTALVPLVVVPFMTGRIAY